MTHITDRALLRSLIVEILKEDKTILQEAINDFAAENPAAIAAMNPERRTRLKKIIAEDFAEYDEVFKALA